MSYDVATSKKVTVLGFSLMDPHLSCKMELSLLISFPVIKLSKFPAPSTERVGLARTEKGFSDANLEET